MSKLRNRGEVTPRIRRVRFGGTVAAPMAARPCRDKKLQAELITLEQNIFGGVRGGRATPRDFRHPELWIWARPLTRGFWF